MKQKYNIGWDIGGAHLKISVFDQNEKIIYVDQIETPIWKGLDILEEAVKTVPEEFLKDANHGITMTGELADIFADRISGVQELVGLFKKILGDNIRIYAADKGWLQSDLIEGNEANIASANWHATAQFAAKKIPQGLLIDIGSTTTDIIPFSDQKSSSMGLSHIGFSDQERLQKDELVYTGVNRTSVATVVSKLPFAGEWQQITTELFSTMGDIYCLTGDIPENADFSTADGKGTSLIDCSRRLARVIGLDVDDAEISAWQNVAEHIARQQMIQISDAVTRVRSRDPEQNLPIVGAGAGRFLIRRVAEWHNTSYIDFADLVEGDEMLQQAAAICAPATACAALLAEKD